MLNVQSITICANTLDEFKEAVDYIESKFGKIEIQRQREIPSGYWLGSDTLVSKRTRKFLSEMMERSK